ILREVAPHPLYLLGMPACGDRAVQRHDVPAPQCVAVVAAAFRAGVLAEVIEVRLSASGQVIVVAGGGSCAHLVTAPACLVKAAKLFGGPSRNSGSAHGEHCARDAIEQVPRCDCAGAAGNLTVGDITRTDE